MTVLEFLRSIIGSNGHREEVIVGVITEGPIMVKSDGSPSEILIFRLDSCPELEFHQAVRPLSPQRKTGDRVKVHYEKVSDRLAMVDWVERA